LHWYWQPNQNNQETEDEKHKITRHNQSSPGEHHETHSTETQDKTGQTEAGFMSHDVRHQSSQEMDCGCSTCLFVCLLGV